jgi:hypothetical protein
MNDIVLLAVSSYLLERDLARLAPTLRLREAEFRDSTWTVVGAARTLFTTLSLTPKHEGRGDRRRPRCGG